MENRLANMAADEKWEKVNRCPLCGSSRDVHDHFAHIVDGSAEIRYQGCQICGLIFQSPRLTAAARYEYYAKAYHQEKMPEADDVARNVWVQERRGQYLVELARSVQPEVQVHLDVGASRGTVMEAFQRDLDCQSFGVEPGERLWQDLRGRGLEAYRDLESLPESLRNRVDLITMSHTLEHLAEPVEYLSALRNHWLRPDGWILFEVPNLYWHPALEFSHLTAYTESSLRSLVNQAGFHLERLIKHGTPYSRRLPLFLLAIISSDGAGKTSLTSIPSFHWVRLQRWLGTSIYRLFQSVASLIYRSGRMNPWRQ